MLITSVLLVGIDSCSIMRYEKLKSVRVLKFKKDSALIIQNVG